VNYDWQNTTLMNAMRHAVHSSICSDCINAAVTPSTNQTRVTSFLNLATEADQNGEREAHSLAETDYEIHSTCQLAFSNEQ